MGIILPVTLTAAAAAAIINIWLSIRVGQMRAQQKVSIGDDAGGPLTARMRAQLQSRQAGEEAGKRAGRQAGKERGHVVLS